MKKKILITVGVLFGLFAIMIGYMVVRDLGEEEKLQKELNKLMSLDLLTSSVDMTIHTKGDYAVVEKVAKTYLNEYITALQKVYNLTQSEGLNNLMEIENLAKDMPNFTKSKLVIKTAQQTLDINCQKIIELSSDKAVMARIKKENLDSYYVDFYKELMLGDKITDDFEGAVKAAKEIRSGVGKLLELELEGINILANNPDAYFIKDNELYMSDDNLIKRYNNLIDESNKIMESL